MPVGEQRVAETGADGEHGPFLNVLHERNFAETLHHRVIVHDDGRVEVTDPRYRFVQGRRQIEAAAFPVARKILRSALDRAVGA